MLSSYPKIWRVAGIFIYWSKNLSEGISGCVYLPLLHFFIHPFPRCPTTHACIDIWLAAFKSSALPRHKEHSASGIRYGRKSVGRWKWRCYRRESETDRASHTRDGALYDATVRTYKVILRIPFHGDILKKNQPLKYLSWCKMRISSGK